MELKKVKDALDSGNISKKKWINEDIKVPPINTEVTIKQNELVKKLHMEGLNQLKEFESITRIKPNFDDEYCKQLKKYILFIKNHEVFPFTIRRKLFIAHINKKFKLNSKKIAPLLKAAAYNKITFNYHQKIEIQNAFDLNELQNLKNILRLKQLDGNIIKKLLVHYKPIGEDVTIEFLTAECDKPSKLRNEKGNRDIKAEIIKGLFSAFLWTSLPEKTLHSYFDKNFSNSNYKTSYWEQLHITKPELFNRDNALHFLELNDNCFSQFDSYKEIRDSLSEFIRNLYNKTNNYGVLAVKIEPTSFGKRFIEWELASDIILYAEKHISNNIKNSFFKWHVIEEKTKYYIKSIDLDKAKFKSANEGFTYKDCFVISNNLEEINSLLIIMQKYERDETLLPCPTCRSEEIQANSYSSLGVKSWECRNQFCLGRSKYNRGKRYSFRGLAMQQAIDDINNEIPLTTVNLWKRDVVSGVNEENIWEMIVRHYSMNGDTIHIHSKNNKNLKKYGRTIIFHPIKLKKSTTSFWNQNFFNRYIVKSVKKAQPLINLGDDNFKVYHGDSSEILKNMHSNSIDGAVTSPPYYNAKEYSQWDNIYCYLYDMFIVNSEVFRVLKPGSHYFYNIFDYFDNEKNIVFSAMGQRRMILSSYTVDMFRRIGFSLLGNIVWDKGEIEGKRAFNNGNFSPYYQSPFNCWEHILIFEKPPINGLNHIRGQKFLSYILKEKPVFKFVNGINRHGHTAPFPDKIPELLIAELNQNSTVLDPFAGSLTTGRVAEKHGLKSILIEAKKEYCDLGLQIRLNEKKESEYNGTQLPLF